MENCKGISKMKCIVKSILERITPIEYIDNILVVNSPVSITSTSITIAGVSIVGSNGVLELPEGTTVGNTPLLSPQYINGIYTLPNNTVIDGTSILNVNYFYFYTTNTFGTTYNFRSGSFINNCGGGYTISSTDAGNFPFFAPADCVLTSLRFSMVMSTESSTSITNVIARIFTVSLSGVQTDTGIVTPTIASVTPQTNNYAEITFQYPLKKGSSVGIRVTFSGGFFRTGISPFATLGYKFS